MPTAASPRSTMRCSATAESTPPDMATAVRARRAAHGRRAIASAMASASASSATAAHACRSRGDLALGEAAREAERSGVEQRAALGLLGAPGGRGARGGAAERAVARLGDRAVGVEPELDAHAIAARRAAGGTVAVGSLEQPRAGEIGEREPHARTAGARSRSSGHERGHRRGEPRAVPAALPSPKRAPQGAERERPPHSHGGERAARLALAAVAGRARRDREALVVEQRAERVAAHAAISARLWPGSRATSPEREPDPGQRGTQRRLVAHRGSPRP